MCAVRSLPVSGGGRTSGRCRLTGVGVAELGSCPTDRESGRIPVPGGRTLALRSESRDIPVAELTPAASSPDEMFEPGLAPAIARLSEAQRCAVVLVDGFGYTLREAAEVLGVTASTVHRDRERALARLRSELEVENAR